MNLKSINEKLNGLSEYSPVLLRFGVGLVFIWFGFSQISRPTDWISFLPAWTAALPLTNSAFVLMNGIFEVVFGSLLLLGFFTRTSALLLGLHLFGIAFSMGYNAIAIRDLGLAVATLAVFLHGKDKWCLSNKD